MRSFFTEMTTRRLTLGPTRRILSELKNKKETEIIHPYE